MATQIKAIETLYNGIHYRSRLEARWAVFFDEIGLCHSYEPAAFRYSGYVPDFSLESRNLTVLVEIKPTFEYVFNAKDKFIDYLSPRWKRSRWRSTRAFPVAVAPLWSLEAVKVAPGAASDWRTVRFRAPLTPSG